jgi:hypothetical protein
MIFGEYSLPYYNSQITIYSEIINITLVITITPKIATRIAISSIIIITI